MQGCDGCAKSRNYGWFITAGGLLLMALTMGIISNCYSVYTIPVTHDMGYTREAFSFSQTMIFIGMMLMTSCVGIVIGKLGLIRTMRCAAFIVPGIYFSYSMTVNILQFYMVSFLIGATIPLITTVPISMLIGEWFRENVGAALGTAMMGSGIGGMIFNPVISFVIRKYGWRFAFRSMSLLMFALIVPIVFLMVRSGPYASEKKVEKNQDSIAEGDLTFSETLKTARFRLFLLLAVLIGAGSYSAINFTPTYLQDAGYTATFAAGVASASMAGLALGKPLLGRIYDRTDLRHMMLVAIIFIFIAEAAFTQIQMPVAIPAVVAGVMIGCPLGTIAAPIITREIFGDRDFSAKCGALVSSGNLGAAFTPVVAGEFYKMTGSFRLMFGIIAILMIAALSGYMILLPKGKRIKTETGG